MNFLQLVNRARVECGVSGPALTTLVGVNPASENGRIIGWVQQAWIDVQASKEDWLFMREPFTFQTVAQQWQYNPATDCGLTDFANWKRDSFRASTAGANYGDEQLLNYMDWGQYRNLYQYANMRNTYQRPVVASVMPNKDLALGAIPDQAYVIDGEYYTQPVTLTADTDTMLIPSRFEMIVVYRAMTYYGGYEAAPEVLSRGMQEYSRMYMRLDIDQLPTVTSGPPLA